MPMRARTRRCAAAPSTPWGTTLTQPASACGGLGEEAAIPHLLPLLRDDDIEVRLGTIRALGAIGGSIAKKALASCLRSSDEVVQEAAEEALEQAEYNTDPLSFTFHA